MFALVSLLASVFLVSMSQQHAVARGAHPWYLRWPSAHEGADSCVKGLGQVPRFEDGRVKTTVRLRLAY